MRFKAKINFRDFVKTQFYLTYKNRWILYITILSLLILLGTIWKLNDYRISNGVDSMFTFRLFFMQIVLIFLPISVYFLAKRTYNNNHRFKEDITYEISNEYIKFIGESFVSALYWSKVYKIIEVKYFFLIYENSQIANFVSKSTLSQPELIELRNIFKTISVSNIKLKNC